MNFKHGLSAISMLGWAPIGVLGCGADAGSARTDDPIAEARDGLYLKPGWGAWPNSTVPVCFTANAQGRSDFQQILFRIREEFERTWGAVGHVDLQFYTPNCPSGAVILVDVMDGNGASSTNPINQTIATNTMFLTASHVLDSSTSNSFYWTTVVHEFGHALGFLHEFQRPGFVATAGCTPAPVTGGNTLHTLVDANTIMDTGYCNTVSDLSLWDSLGVRQLYGPQAAAFTPLVNGNNATTGDNWLGTVNVGAVSAPYVPARAEGWGWVVLAPGTTGLYQYINDANGDHVTVGLSAGTSIVTGLRNLGLLAYVYTSSQPGTVPLKFYKNRFTGEFLTTITPPPPSAFILVSTEGYVFQDRPYKVLQQYFNSSSTDRATLSQDSTLLTYNLMGSNSYRNLDSVILKYNVTGTTALDTFHSANNTDYYTSTTSPGGDYTRVETQGYVFTSPWTTTGSPRALNQYYSASARDGYVSISAAADGTYSSQGIAGYAFPIHSF